MKCRYCNNQFSNTKALKLHHDIDHVSLPYSCSCGRTYPTWHAADNHLKKCKFVDSPNTASVVLRNNGEEKNDSAESAFMPDFPNVSESCGEGTFRSPHCEFSSLLQVKTEEFVSSLYMKGKMPRQYVQDIINDVDKFVCDTVLASLKDALISSVKLSDDQTNAINSVFDKFNNPFSMFSSEYLRFKYFKASGDFIEPISYEVGEIDVTVPTDDGPKLKRRKVYGQAVPLDRVLKKFLELPNCLAEILSYMDKLSNNTDTKENFVQCTLWKKKRSRFSPNDIVIPLHFYYDDVECNNPLGSRSLKLGAVYVMIPCLPPECQSSIDNIFLTLIFETWLRNFSDEKAFKPLIRMFKDLEENGILVDTGDGESKRVYFVSGLLLGDNLGLNSVCGFVESFTSNYFCRFCRAVKCVAVRQTVEDVSLLRTVESHKEDLLLDDPSLTGLKKESVLNDLPSFHVVENPCVDMFHDFSEGISHYVMIHVLNNCIKKKYFSLQELNNRIDLFQYGRCDSNRIPIVTENFAERDKFKMSGSETMLFVKMFGILIGDKVPHSDPYWLLYLKLVHLIDVCSDINCSNNSSSLKVLVKEFNEMYLSVTGEDLKPKMHFLIHYILACEQGGPVSLMSTKRCESKHRALLIPAHATESRRNICKTVAIQHQLAMCHRFRSKKPLIPEAEIGPVSILDLSECDNYLKFVSYLPECIRTAESVLSPNWINIKGTDYKPGMAVVLRISESGAPVFGVIELIVLLGDKVFFLYSNLLNIGYDEHVHAYEVELDSFDVWHTVNQKDLYNPLPLSIYFSVTGSKFVVMRHAL